MYASPSGHGGEYCEQGVPTELALLSILAAFAVSFGILYMTSTTNMAAGRKRRNDDLNFGDLVQDVMWKGKISPVTNAKIHYDNFKTGSYFYDCLVKSRLQREITAMDFAVTTGLSLEAVVKTITASLI